MRGRRQDVQFTHSCHVAKVSSDDARASAEAFCKSVETLVPQASGQRGLIGEIMPGAVGLLVQAVKDIYLRAKDDDVLTRKTIQTQLEATSWPAFASVLPLS
jgi:hypothetical protein